MSASFVAMAQARTADAALPAAAPPAPAPPAIAPGAPVRLCGLSRSDLNGKVGTALKFHADKERYAVRIDGGGTPLLIKPNNLVVKGPAPRPQKKKSDRAFARALASPQPSAPTVPLTPRDGSGAWDDLDEQQVHLSLSEAESHSLRSKKATGPSLWQRVASGLQSGELRAYCNPPRYDRLLLSARRTDVMGSVTYIVEASLDAWEGRCGWITTDYQEKDLALEGLVEAGAAAVEAEYASVFRFFELCHSVGPPRYTVQTSLDPDAKPHVLAMVEKLVGGTALRCLLPADAAAPPSDEGR